MKRFGRPDASAVAGFNQGKAGPVQKTQPLRAVLQRGPGGRAHIIRQVIDVALLCGSAWKRDPVSGVIGVEKGPLIPDV